MIKQSITKLVLAGCALSFGGLAMPACGGGDDDKPKGRGLPAGVEPAKAKSGSRRSDAAKATAAEDEVEVAVRPDRPKQTLTREDFARDSRDPFRNYNEVTASEVTPDEPRERQREVRMADYNFEDMVLIGIVHSGKGVQPRALWKATDGKSKTIRQGEYFSRAEVLLATVNRDYVEIEVVDDELAKGLNMERGERRAVYLKEE
jgi:Tfp pilus assembly protein PilP